MAEGSAAGQVERRTLVEERLHEVEGRRREGEELQRLRREHREALAEVAEAQAQASETRDAAEAHKVRLEALLEEHPRRLQQVEAGGRSADLADALFVCLRERAALLRFVADLLQAHHTMLYDSRFCLEGLSTTPVATTRRGSSSARGGIRGRASSAEWPRVAGGSWSCSCPSAEGGGAHGLVRMVTVSPRAAVGTGPSGSPTVSADLHDLAASLKAELEGTARSLQLQAQRVAAEADQSARALGTVDATVEDVRGMRTPHEFAVHRACAFWLEQERAQYHATARLAESKFAQLAKVRRLLQARPGLARKRGCRA